MGHKELDMTEASEHADTQKERWRESRKEGVSFKSLNKRGYVQKQEPLRFIKNPTI